jgi:hypothetical protein
MPYFFEFMLFLLPFGAYALWRWFNPGIEPDRHWVISGVIGIVLMLAFAIWFGVSVSMKPHAVYVPAELGPDGRVLPGRVAPEK